MDALLDAIALQSRAISSEEWQGQGIAKQLSNRVHTSYVMNRVRSGRGQPQRWNCVLGCGWWGCLLSLSPLFFKDLSVKNLEV